MRFYVGDKVYVCTNKEGALQHLYDGQVVEADDDRVRIVVRPGTHGWWYEQETGLKIGVSTRFISRSIDDV